MKKVVHLLGILLLLLLTKSIIIPLNERVTRCMIVFGSRNTDTLKIEMDFPPIPNRLNEELYKIVATDLGTKKTYIKSIIEGVLKYQLEVTGQVIYKVCLTALTKRHIRELNVQFSAENQFEVSPSNFDVPENLLKSQDLKGTFHHAHQITKIAQIYTLVQAKRRQYQDETFNSINGTTDILIILSIFELGVITFVAALQLVFIRKFLKRGQFI